ncbi:SNF2 family N-terminal domain-containing protein [Phascolomyces articulosus]|uniref:SNF2 family N-terminal domain-containing protein n=1 Tax=Phascolomyces articulosus TaxID=60185 RepID=A0AAD5JVD3_9FUNG|nr:SNF2 family N-terminal domain-containing protein [Phascolomyces articulosus]
MPKLNRLTIDSMAPTPSDLLSLSQQQSQPLDHLDMTDPPKRRRIDPFSVSDPNHHYRHQQQQTANNNNNNSNSNTNYARSPFASLPARLNYNRQQLYTSPLSQSQSQQSYYQQHQPQQQQQHNPHPLHRSQSLASLRSNRQEQQTSYPLTTTAPSRPLAPTLTPSLSMHTGADLYNQQQQQLRPQSHPISRHHYQQQQQQPSSAPPLSPAITPQQTINQVEKDHEDDDLILDEEMTNKNVCVGMIKTDIVTMRVLDLIKDEQFEPIHLESEGRRDSVNYSFTVTSRAVPRKFYGWVPFEDTKILGPLVDHGLIWWDAVIPRGKVNHARTPLYIIIYCRPIHVEVIAKTFEYHRSTLKEPPFFNPACRYKNPHTAQLQQQQQQENNQANQRLWSVGRPGGINGRGYSPAAASFDSQAATEQTRRDIAQLLDSIDDDETRRESRKRKKRREKLQKTGTRDNQIVLSDDDDDEKKVDKMENMKSSVDNMKIDGKEEEEEEEEEEDEEVGTQVDGLKVRLMPHQSRGVDWMIGREANETSCGGILADDMGLGKTIQTIGLIVSTMDTASKRPTLIITPLALIQQWATEIRTKTEKNKLSVLVYHGSNRSKDPSIFSQYDVVVTTYHVVASDTPNPSKRGRRRNNNNNNGGLDEEMMDVQTPGASEDGMTPSNSAPGSPNHRKQENDSHSLTKPGYGPLFQIEWYRVVLDEAQQIKNRNTRAALSCTELGAQKRWCLTGTPMQNHVDELYSLLRFLRIQPLCDYQTFKKTISVPIQAGQGQLAMERLKVVLMAVMLRRTKHILKSASEEEEQEENPAPTQETSIVSETTSTATTPDQQHASSSSSSSPGNNNDSTAITKENVQKETSEPGNHLSTELSLKLPPRNKRDVVLTFSNAERTFYDFLNNKTKSTVQRLMRAGKGERTYFNMLCMLLRLRQACDHPRLVLEAMGKDADALELATGNTNGNNTTSTSTSTTISSNHGMVLNSNGVGVRKEIREASEAAAQRTIMAKMAADLGWQGVGQVGQSVFDKDNASNSTGTGNGSNPVSLCELCGRTLKAKTYSGNGPSSYCSTCKGQIEFYTNKRQQQNGNNEDHNPHDKDDDSPLMTTSSKINKVLEILDETRLKYPREKTIIFSQFTSMLELIEEQLKRLGLKYCRYDGSMSNQVRERNLEALRSDNECTVMLISLKCGSLGLNLTAANHVILMDVWWNPAVEEQAIDRVHRIGQRLPVRVIRLVMDGTIEQKIIQLQQKKAYMVQSALGDGMLKNTKLSMAEIRTLFDI